MINTKKVIEAGARRNGVKNYLFNANPSLPLETQEILNNIY